MLNFSDELISKAKEAKSVEDLLVLAKENNVELTEEEAQDYFTQLNQKSGELPDEELDNVVGGGCDFTEYNSIPVPQASDTIPNRYKCRFCGEDTVELKEGWKGNVFKTTYTCLECKKIVYEHNI
jgi:DNA-directed RNA polymerase subunit RPC12/RpoP